jgi:hypothetical protein
MLLPLEGVDTLAAGAAKAHSFPAESTIYASGLLLEPAPMLPDAREHAKGRAGSGCHKSVQTPAVWRGKAYSPGKSCVVRGLQRVLAVRGQNGT